MLDRLLAVLRLFWRWLAAGVVAVCSLAAGLLTAAAVLAGAVVLAVVVAAWIVSLALMLAPVALLVIPDLAKIARDFRDEQERRFQREREAAGIDPSVEC